MNRSVRQGSHERFVTPHRLLTLLRGTRLGKGPLDFPGAADDEEDSVMSSVADEEDEVLGSRTRQRGKLEAIGFTEFMDSAINKPVLDELLFRGGYLAEYEEQVEPDEVAAAWIESLSDSDMGPIAPSPSPSPFTSTTPLPPLEPFHARHLQSSHSRSPIGHRRSSLSSSVAEDSGEDDEDVATEDEDGGHATDASGHADDEDAGSNTGSVRGRSHISRAYTPRYPLHRRSSGSAFAPPTSLSDDNEERGRDRHGRDPLPHRTSAPGAPPGRQRFNRSLMPPPSSTLNRSSSVPAHHAPHAHVHFGRGSHSRPPGNYPRGQSLDTERSSSVPASVSGRRRGGLGAVRIVQTLEGSMDVKAIRALDLCGCVSRIFM